MAEMYLHEDFAHHKIDHYLPGNQALVGEGGVSQGQTQHRKC